MNTQQTKEIMRLYRYTEHTKSDIARMFDVGPDVIHVIVNGRNRKNEQSRNKFKNRRD